jgi:hypothetical protein
VVQDEPLRDLGPGEKTGKEADVPPVLCQKFDDNRANRQFVGNF